MVPFYNRLTPNEYYFNVCCDLYKYGIEVAPKREYGFGPNAVRPRTTKELHPVFTFIHEPRKRIITTMGRVLNLPFALAEVVQILGGINDAQALRYYNSKIMDFQGDAPDAVRFNAAYGERLRHYDIRYGDVNQIDSPYTDNWEGIDQLTHIIQTLMKDPDSRQATAVISHPYWDNYKRITKDRACNLVSHAMIRDGKLDWLQVMRSNDIIFGLPYNFFQWCHVQEYVAAQLGVPVGTYTLVQDSLHCYDNQYQELANLSGFDMYDYFVPEEYFPMQANIGDVIRFEKSIRQMGSRDLPRDREYEYWREVVEVFNSYAAFKRHEDFIALSRYMPHTFELRWPLMRWYVHTRWRKDEKYSDLVEAVKDDLVKHGFPQVKLDEWLGFDGSLKS